LEDEADDRPGHVVDGRGGRDEGGTGEDDGEVDVFDEGVGEFAGDEVACEREDGADEEEEDERVVDLAFGELEGGADDAPLLRK